MTENCERLIRCHFCGINDNMRLIGDKLIRDPRSPNPASLPFGRSFLAALKAPRAFSAPEDEIEFLARYRTGNAFAYIAAVLIGGFSLLGFFASHALIRSSYGSEDFVPQALRLSMAIALFLIAYLYAAKKDWFTENFAIVGSIAPGIAILGIAMLPFAMADPTQPDFPIGRFFLSLATTIWICFAFSRVGRYTMLAICAVASALISSFAVMNDPSHSVFLSLHLVVAIVAGWLLSSFVEKRERQVFVGRRRQAIESRSVADNLERSNRINQMQSEAMRTITHDIRQPMLSLSLYADLVGSTANLTRPSADYLEKLKQCLAATESAISSVEQTIQMAQQSTAISVRAISPSKPMSILMAVYEPTIRSARIDLVVDINVLGEVTLETNEHAFVEIFSNLIANACNHAWPIRSRRDRTLRIDCQIASGHAVISVSDNGVGLDASQKNRVFERGFQGDRQGGHHGGQGLGLAIVKELVDNLPSHTISLVSEEHIGTTFSVTIPLCREKAPPLG